MSNLSSLRKFSAGRKVLTRLPREKYSDIAVQNMTLKTGFVGKQDSLLNSVPMLRRTCGGGVGERNPTEMIKKFG